MLLPALIYITFSLTATAGIFWIALEIHDRRAAVISAGVTFLFFFGIGWALLRFVIPKLEQLTM